MLDTLRRYTKRQNIPILISEDLCVPVGSGKPRITENAQNISFGYRDIAQRYGARHIVSDHRVGLEGNVHQAMENTDAPFVVMCSDDILFTDGAMDAIVSFYEKNQEKLDRVAGQHVLVTHAHTPETEDLISLGIIKSLNDFYSKPSFLHIYDGRIPTHPQNSLGICSGFHGSIGVISRKYWNLIGGISKAHWIWDQDFSTRVMLQTDGFFIRIPMPTLAHFGAASIYYGEQFPQGGPSNENHRRQLEILCTEHGEQCESWEDELKASRRLSEKCDAIARQRASELEPWLRSLIV